MTRVNLKKPVFVALDIDDSKQAMQMAQRLQGHVGGFKVGPRLSFQMGAEWCQKLSEIAPLFIDNKYFDIPSTMLAAVRSSFNAGASFVTVHALSGREALTELAKLETELNKVRPFQILAVTVLTSWSSESRPSVLTNKPISAHVEELCQLILESGLTGVVCSPHELEIVRAVSTEFFTVTPGIRLPADDCSDQKRVMTPQEALAKGASALVMGRSILTAKDPVSILAAL